MASSSARDAPRRAVALLAQGGELGPRERPGDPALGVEVLEVPLAALLVEERLLELDPLLDLGRHLDLELRPAEVGPGLGGLLLELEELHAEVDLLLLDLLLRLRELGPLLGQLPLEDLGVEPEDALALLHRLALGGEERDLEVHLGHRRHPDLGRAHRDELAFDLDRQHEVGLLRLDRHADVGARGPGQEEHEHGGRRGGAHPPAPPDASHPRDELRRERHDRPPRAPTPRRTRPACTRSGGPSPRSRPRDAPPAPPSRGARRRGER